jgi:hypothetical protein
MSTYYNQCLRGVGKPAQIRTRDGRVHRGTIERVSPNRVYIRPYERRNFYGLGYGFYGGYGGWGWGAGYGIALAAIAALAFIPFFW